MEAAGQGCFGDGRRIAVAATGDLAALRASPAAALAVRPVRESERTALRALHATSWRRVYSGLVPDTALGDPLDRHMAARWAVLPSGVLGAWDGDALAGFVRLARRGGWPYIDNLHVDPARHRGGTGRRLMLAALDRLAQSGEGRVWLTVVSANRGARAFYAALGGCETAPIVETLLGQHVIARPVIWNRLIRRPGR